MALWATTWHIRCECGACEIFVSKHSVWPDRISERDDEAEGCIYDWREFEPGDDNRKGASTWWKSQGWVTRGGRWYWAAHAPERKAAS